MRDGTNRHFHYFAPYQRVEAFTTRPIKKNNKSTHIQIVHRTSSRSSYGPRGLLILPDINGRDYSSSRSFHRLIQLCCQPDICDQESTPIRLVFS